MVIEYKHFFSEMPVDASLQSVSAGSSPYKKYFIVKFRGRPKLALLLIR